MGIKAFFKKAFGDMKESTKAQHEVAPWLYHDQRGTLCDRRCTVYIWTWRNQQSGS